MFHVLFIVLVLAMAVVEATLLEQWTRQYAVVEQAVVTAPLAFRY